MTLKFGSDASCFERGAVSRLLGAELRWMYTLTWVQGGRDNSLVSVPPCQLRSEDNVALTIPSVEFQTTWSE